MLCAVPDPSLRDRRRHLVGKWHQGFYSPQFLPTRRGFLSFFGFLGGCEDHITQRVCGTNRCRAPGRSRRFKVVDLWRDERPARGENGTMGTTLFINEATAIVRRHRLSSGPLFLMLALQDVHSPYQVEESYASLYNHTPPLQRTWSGMVTRMDACVGQLATSLRKARMWQTTLFAFVSDSEPPAPARVRKYVPRTRLPCLADGSPVCGWQPGGTNAPLRGGKGSMWEGGVRTVGLINGGWLPKARKGTALRGLAHIVDLHATLCAIASGGSLDGCPPDAGPAPMDSLSLRGWLLGEAAQSPRNWIVHGHTRSSEDSVHCWNASFVGAIRSGDYKLLVGPAKQATWFGSFSPNATIPRSRSLHALAAGATGGMQTISCDERPCLFNIRDDPTEHVDLAEQQPERVGALLKRFHELEGQMHPPPDEFWTWKNSTNDYCAAASTHGDIIGPWRHGPMMTWRTPTNRSCMVAQWSPWQG